MTPSHVAAGRHAALVWAAAIFCLRVLGNVCSTWLVSVRSLVSVSKMFFSFFSFSFSSCLLFFFSIYFEKVFASVFLLLSPLLFFSTLLFSPPSLFSPFPFTPPSLFLPLPSSPPSRYPLLPSLFSPPCFPLCFPFFTNSPTQTAKFCEES